MIEQLHILSTKAIQLVAKKPANGIIEDAKKIAVLATPIRLELVTTIQALGGAATAAELAVQLGRPADGLYYHLRALVRGGLVEERAEASARRYHLTVPKGEHLSLRYKPGATANARAVARVASSMSRLAQRDFVRSVSQGGTVTEGPSRELWVARLRGWVDPAELAEVNQLLQRLAELLLHTRPTDTGKLIALHWILAPIDAKPARRK
ncbi:helix-turn-helix domain-containing protein [Rhodanobacter sp. MP7CTX1]|uniref:winged helix-turn-helix domain-containing protein n=1 Tax=Rhodanobacter sp. MP7CTX1 TaxID=2723084 RepID=UPI00161DB354|nr:helix-turn-helix domain-containing protein [Rhodanobacter sp. MP7CTX1]MBB6186446.1 DNA-binding transcriptional ArsR family regulator [Rhodanobacter sp. MP7CTX1]